MKLGISSQYCNLITHTDVLPQNGKTMEEVESASLGREAGSVGTNSRTKYISL